MEIYLAVVAGAIITMLFGLNEVYGKPEFAWNIFFMQNWLPTVLNLLCGGVIVWFRADLINILPITGLTAVFVGSTGQLIFKKLAKVFDRSVDTYVGIK